MQAAKQLALAEATSPLHFEVSDLTNSGTLAIKGFMSVEIEDRDGQMALADSFEIDKYLVSPIILVNHKYWNKDGNPVPVGSTKSIHMTQIEEHPEDEALVYVRDLTSNEIISDFPKAKIPRANVGTKGVFVFVDITNPDIIEMIGRKELGAFSWRGPIHVTYRHNKEKGIVEEVIDKVDLWEISVVGTPANFAAGFVVGKSVYALRFPKQLHKTKGDVLKFLSDHSLDFSNVNEDDRYFFCYQMDQMTVKKSLNDFTIEDAGAGISAIAGNHKDDWLSIVLKEEQPQTTPQKSPPEEEMSDQKPADQNVDFESFLTKMDEKFQITMKGAVEALSTQVVGIKEAIKTELSEEISALKSQFEELKTTHEAAKQVDTSKELSQEEQKTQLEELVKQAVDAANQAIELAKQSNELAQTVAKSVPTKTQTEVSKTATTDQTVEKSAEDKQQDIFKEFMGDFQARIVA